LQNTFEKIPCNYFKRIKIQTKKGVQVHYNHKDNLTI
jgi:hypothetical protein